MADFATIDLAGFTRDLDGADDEVAKNVLDIQRKVTLQVLDGVVKGTPVDTGRARGNWQVTADRPAAGEVERLDRSGGATIAAGLGASRGIRPFGVSFVSNNVPYIRRLEEGHSNQSRAFVAATVARVNAQFA